MMHAKEVAQRTFGSDSWPVSFRMPDISTSPSMARPSGVVGLQGELSPWQSFSRCYLRLKQRNSSRETVQTLVSPCMCLLLAMPLCRRITGVEIREAIGFPAQICAEWSTNDPPGTCGHIQLLQDLEFGLRGLSSQALLAPSASCCCC